MSERLNTTLKSDDLIQGFLVHYSLARQALAKFVRQVLKLIRRVKQEKLRLLIVNDECGRPKK